VPSSTRANSAMTGAWSSCPPFPRRFSGAAEVSGARARKGRSCSMSRWSMPAWRSWSSSAAGSVHVRAALGGRRARRSRPRGRGGRPPPAARRRRVPQLEDWRTSWARASTQRGHARGRAGPCRLEDEDDGPAGQAVSRSAIRRAMVSARRAEAAELVQPLQDAGDDRLGFDAQLPPPTADDRRRLDAVEAGEGQSPARCRANGVSCSEAWSGQPSTRECPSRQKQGRRREFSYSLDVRFAGAGR